MRGVAEERRPAAGERGGDGALHERRADDGVRIGARDELGGRHRPVAQPRDERLMLARGIGLARSGAAQAANQ